MLAAMARLEPARVEHVLVDARGRATPVDAAERPVAGTARWHDFAAALAGARSTGRRSTAAQPAADDLAQLLFTSGTSGEPKGVLHRFDALTRAAAMEIEHLGLGRDDTIFIPSPLAHQTGFLYGMWLAFALGRPRSSRTSGTAAAARPRCAQWAGSFVQAATPFLADLVRVVEQARRRRRRPCGSSSSPAPRCRGPWPSGPPASSTPRSAAPGARPSPASAALAAPGDDPEHGLGHRRPRARGHPAAHHRRRRQRARPRPGGQLRGPQPLPVRGLPRPPRPDRRGDHGRRLVPHRRPGDDRRGRLPAHHRAGQGRHQPRRREDPGRRDRAAAAPPPAGVAEVAIVAMPDQRLGERACAFAVLPDRAFDFDLAGCATTSTR